MVMQTIKDVPGDPVAVRFVVDYRGVLTGERFYQAGDVAEFPHGNAMELVNAGRAELVAPAAEKKDEKPPSKKKAKKDEESKDSE